MKSTPTEPPFVEERRAFLRGSALSAAAAALCPVHLMLPLPAPDPVRDAMQGLLALVVPGNDAYSVQQGVSTPDPGAPDAGLAGVLVFALDLAVPFQPGFSAVFAAILDGIAAAVDPGSPGGPFGSAFANLSFTDKVKVLAFMESDPQLFTLAGAVLQLTGFLCYSEAGVLDPTTGTLAGSPLGWALSGWGGVADGHASLIGYFENRRHAG